MSRLSKVQPVKHPGLVIIPSTYLVFIHNLRLLAWQGAPLMSSIRCLYVLAACKRCAPG